jgi:hypothetical protein
MSRCIRCCPSTPNNTDFKKILLVEKVRRWEVEFLGREKKKRQDKAVEGYYRQQRQEIENVRRVVEGGHFNTRYDQCHSLI